MQSNQRDNEDKWDSVDAHYKKIIPFIPRKINPDDLDENGKLVEDDSSSISMGTNSQYRCYKKPLAEGAYGKVFLAYEQENDQWHVIKIIIKKENCSQDEAVCEEVHFLKKAGRNAVEIKDSVGAKFKSLGETDCFELAILQDLASGIELHQFFQAHPDPQLSTFRWLQLFHNCCRALSVLHENDIIHCDIKPENIVFDPCTGNVSIIDFGFAIENTRGNQKNKKLRGTPGFAAPEIFSSKIYTEKSDIYALGVTFLECMGKIKFSYNRDGFTPFEIVDQSKPTFIQNKVIRNQLLELCKNMTDSEPNKRLTLIEVIAIIENLKQQMIQTSRARVVGLLDIDEFLSLTSNKNMLNSLKVFDEVVLIETKDHKIKEYCKVKKQLEDDGISVSEYCFTGKDLSGVFHNISEEEKSEKVSSEEVRNYFFVSTDSQLIETHRNTSLPNINVIYADAKNTNDFREEIFKTISVTSVTEDHLKIVFGQLNADIQRLNKKWKFFDASVQPRIDAIQGTKNLLDQKKSTLTYAELNTHLEDLEKDLHISTFWQRLICDTSSKKETMSVRTVKNARQNLEELKNSIDGELHRFKTLSRRR